MCGENEPKKRFFKVSREGMGSWVSRDWGTILDSEFDAMELGDKISIEVVEMTESQLEALPEFQGW
jgi:hypothetical protein